MRPRSPCCAAGRRRGHERGAFLTALRFHAAAHPALGAEDADKLCYQAAFGPAHLVSDGAAARRAFREEFARAQEEDAPAFEPVSDGYARCGLAAWKRLGLPGDWLLNMCLLSLIHI